MALGDFSRGRFGGARRTRIFSYLESSSNNAHFKRRNPNTCSCSFRASSSASSRCDSQNRKSSTRDSAAPRPCKTGTRRNRLAGSVLRARPRRPRERQRKRKRSYRRPRSIILWTRCPGPAELATELVVAALFLLARSTLDRLRLCFSRTRSRLSSSI